MSEKPATGRRKAAAAQPVIVREDRPEQGVVPYDENLLERARNQWQFGDWLRLTQMSADTLEHHPDRAKLALLAAAGHLQSGNAQAARRLIHLAQDWGCGEQLIRRVLIAGVYNSIGRAYSVIGNLGTGMRRFEKAVEVGSPGSDIQLLAKARAGHQLEELGLTPGSQGRLQQQKGLAALSRAATGGESASNGTQPAAANGEALAFYQRLGAEADEGIATPFVLIDSKSLPRSGLHYLRDTLSRLLEDHFSFCEWYNETGCCKSRPCALTGYATYARENCRLRLRMTKSHDFELADPPLSASKHLRRLILVRDPLFILTSWFALEQLGSCRPALQTLGIDMRKIWLLHEKELLASAYQVLDKHFREPDVDRLAVWLATKSKYLTGFLEKWVRPALESPSEYVQVVRYEEIDQYAFKLVEEFRDYLPAETRARIANVKQAGSGRFHRRNDPFAAPAKLVSEYLSKHAPLFEKAASQIRDIQGLSHVFQ